MTQSSQELFAWLCYHHAAHAEQYGTYLADCEDQECVQARLAIIALEDAAESTNGDRRTGAQHFPQEVRARKAG